jgi:hypothetical protein
MNSSSDPAVLLTFVTTSDEGAHKINLYGTPAGLRSLAEKLLKQADVDQQAMKYLGDHDTDHTHIKVTHRSSILAPSSDELQLGRLDLRTGELASWARERITAAELKEGRFETVTDEPSPEG